MLPPIAPSANGPLTPFAGRSLPPPNVRRFPPVQGRTPVAPPPYEVGEGDQGPPTAGGAPRWLASNARAFGANRTRGRAFPDLPAAGGAAKVERPTVGQGLGTRRDQMSTGAGSASCVIDGEILFHRFPSVRASRQTFRRNPLPLGRSGRLKSLRPTAPAAVRRRCLPVDERRSASTRTRSGLKRRRRRSRSIARAVSDRADPQTSGRSGEPKTPSRLPIAPAKTESWPLQPAARTNILVEAVRSSD